VEIEIYSDVVCPWCYIGMRRLMRVVESDGGPVTLRWRAFQLDPSAPESPRPLLESLAEKFGGPERARQITERTAAVAAAEGIELNFDRALSANTFDAHRLIWFAARAGKQAVLVEALHRAHFTDGLDIGSPWVLAQVADSVDVNGAAAFLSSDAGVREVRAELDHARELGITAVPTFVFAGKYAITGAQEESTLRQVLEEVRRREASAA